MPLPPQSGPTNPTNGRWIIENLIAFTLLGLPHVPACRVHPQATKSLSTTLTLSITTLTLLARLKHSNELWSWWTRKHKTTLNQKSITRVILNVGSNRSWIRQGTSRRSSTDKPGTSSKLFPDSLAHYYVQGIDPPRGLFFSSIAIYDPEG